MDPAMSTQERQLCQFLAGFPAECNYQYNEAASRKLLTNLFWSLAGGNAEYLRLMFPEGKLNQSLKLSDAQGAVEGAEYTDGARGKRCGHIFKPGEATYACRTCGTDETCCLCSRCFEATDHTGHMVRMHMSMGNSGCCDCGDEEAWRTPLFCTIHSDMEKERDKGKGKAMPSLPENLITNLQMTIARVFDYMCDVISCSPEQLRQSKTEESVLKDEETSRLLSTYYGPEVEPCTDFSLVLWNDEKHTVREVRDQVARACQKRLTEALKDAWDVDAHGRTILASRSGVKELLTMAKTIESIRITVTIRSARDTFREQMCGTIVEWLSDIAGCAVGDDNHILRITVCEELMQPWRRGSPATHIDGLIDDEDQDDQEVAKKRRIAGANANFLAALRQAAGATPVGFEVDMEDDDDDDDIDDDDRYSAISGEYGDEEEEEDDDDEEDEDVMMVDARDDVGDVGLGWSQDQALEEDEATMAGYPPPPPPPPAAAGRAAPRERDATPSDSDTGAEPLIAPALYAKTDGEVPKTPGKSLKLQAKPGKYWLETPPAYTKREHVHPAEDVFERVRLDWLLLFDLRMWKKVRIDLRALYISTVVQVPEFKRLLALRFSSLYTILAQLYLVGDREPDHSIINLSLQMLTTPSITAEIVERGNFLSSLLAILYTFLTSRQVGHCWDISPDAVLGFESGSVTNRRMYHFYQDLKYLFGSPHVQERVRCEPRYLMQFLDLVKLHQGIGPNIRAVAEHVEYEADSWITASLVTRQINVQARSLAEAFRNCPPEDMHHLQRAIRFTARTVVLNSIGAERHRFRLAEVKDEIHFKTVVDYEMAGDTKDFSVVKFVVEKDHISFHHALHYTLSWLIEHGRSMPASTVKTLLSFTPQDLRTRHRLMGKLHIPKMEGFKPEPEDYLMTLFDFPLRVCAWLAQIKANMWVRNGISLRHQASTYRGVSQRDLAHHRDIFLLQTAMVICDQERVLASIIDRFGMDSWVKGFYELKSEAQDDHQHLDVVEDMLHLLIILLSDRTSLTAPSDEPSSRLLAMRRDLIHVLCFKPMSFNEIGNRLPEKYQESEDFQRILDEMATYKPPEGISDVGTFELRADFIEEIDPYIAHYNKNQREESEMAYRKKMAKKTGKRVEEIVYEPKPRPLTSGLFEHLASFTGSGVFAQIIYYCLLYPLVYSSITPTIPATRLETYLQVVLHLMLLAIHEDNTDEESMDNASDRSFVHLALTRVARTNFLSEDRSQRTIIAILNKLSTKDEFKSAHPKIVLVLKRLKQKRPHEFEAAFNSLGIPVDRVNTASPAVNSAEEERERRKRAALNRQAKVMEQFQQQQKSFMENQKDIDWGSGLDEDDEAEQPTEERSHTWKYPTGTCILCQEAADDRRLYGTFAMFNESRILRQTDFQDLHMVREALQTPCSLDRSADDIRPFGVSGENRKMVQKFNSQGESFLAERQTIGKGFPANISRAGPVASGCGHLMHWRCFEMYFEATKRRHTHQIARHHPEEIKRNEFVCPLCKALGNAFLPIVWKGLGESYPAQLQPQTDLAQFVEKYSIPLHASTESKAREVSSEVNPDMSTPSFPGSLVETLLNPRPASESAWGASVPDSSAVPLLRGQLARPDDPEAAHMQQAMLRAWGEEVGGSGPSNTLVTELLGAYKRLGDTIAMNWIHLQRSEYDKALPPRAQGYSGALVQAVGFSVSASEIQQRGVESQPGMTLLEKIPEQVLTHLRILSETASSYIAVGMTQEPGLSEQVAVDFQGDSERQRSQLLTRRPSEADAPGAVQTSTVHPPLLSLDAFIFFVECTYGLIPAQKVEVAHVLRLCYLAELVKVTYHMCRNMPAHAWVETLSSSQTRDPAVRNFAEFAAEIGRHSLDTQAGPNRADDFSEATGAFQQPGVDTLDGWYSLTKKYALAFLRKSLLYMNVKYGVDFNNQFSTNPEADELERLTEILRVPSFDDMCAAMTSHREASGWPEPIQQLVYGWISHDLMWSEKDPEGVESAKVSHPGIFELIGLPKNYDTLIEEATRRRCPTRGKDLTDPTLCLFCGEFFCGQSTCCQKSVQLPGSTEQYTLGGAQQHMLKCQWSIGAFINIRKCSTVFLHHRSGSYTATPYTDKYGETDQQLRHGRQLFLNQKRYDTMIRNIVLSHGIPSLVSRKLESEINTGGWDTF